MPDAYAVLGYPIQHSLSPQIHSLFAEQTGQDLSYSKLEALPEEMEETIARFIAAGGCGLNVTLPFKTRVMPLATRVSTPAEIAGAANTLVIEQKTIVLADSTDGRGLLLDLKQLDLPLAEKHLLVVGAGGACRSILHGLLRAGAKIALSNRTFERAAALAAAFSIYGHIQAVPLSEVSAHAPFDAVINTTSASLSNALPDLPDSVVAGLQWGYDLAYSDIAEGETVFTRWLKQHGLTQAYDGLGMLVQQAAESFHLWRGVRPETANVVDALRHQHHK